MKVIIILASLLISNTIGQSCLNEFIFKNKDCLTDWKEQFPEAAEALLGCSGNGRPNRQLRADSRELGTKQLGDTCTMDSQCASNMCSNNVCVCTANNQCPSNKYCSDTNTCLPKLKESQVCDEPSDCLSNLCFIFGSSQGKCLCSANSHCISGDDYCTSNGVCELKKNNYETCSSGDECQSNKCLYGRCGPYDNGLSCQHWSQCKSNNCENNVCRGKNTVGQVCTQSYQCQTDICVNGHCGCRTAADCTNPDFPKCNNVYVQNICYDFHLQSYDYQW